MTAGLQAKVTEFETGAIRDIKEIPSSWEKFSLPALMAVANQCKDNEFNNWKDYSPMELVGFAITSVYNYTSSPTPIPDRDQYLAIAFRHLMYAYELKTQKPGQILEIQAMHQAIGHESQGSNHLHLLSYGALKKLAETRYEGGVKYGSWNWLNGFPIMSVLSHALEHMWAICGAMYDEDHWGHAFCNLMFAIHFTIFRKDMIKGQLGQDYTLTDEIRKELEEHRALREKLRIKEEEDERRLRESAIRLDRGSRNDFAASADASPVGGWGPQADSGREPEPPRKPRPRTRKKRS